jgi:branched-chain amino acid transport system permease protein
MNITLLTYLVLSAVVLGAVYLVMALGLTLVYGVTRVFNFAQGSLYIWAGYIAYTIYTGFQLNWGLVVAITLGISFAIGFAQEKVMIYPLRRLTEWRWGAVIVTLGGALFLDSLAMWFFGTAPRSLPRISEGILKFGTVSIPIHDLATIFIAIAIVIILNRFLSKSRTGMSMTGVAQDSVGANIVGIPLDRMYGYSFGIAGLLAGVSAMLLTPRLPLFPAMGWTIFVRAFTVLMFGGLGSMKGAVIAAFLLSFIETFVTHHLGAVWALPITLIILVCVLSFRPKGLFGVW